MILVTVLAMWNGRIVKEGTCMYCSVMCIMTGEVSRRGTSVLMGIVFLVLTKSVTVGRRDVGEMENGV